MGFLDSLRGGLKGLKLRDLTNAFGGGQGLLGAGLGLYGAHKMSQPSYDKGYLSDLNSRLGPLQQAFDKFGDLAGEYEDPNSALNQKMRSDLRTQNLSGFADIARRARNQSTGVYGSGKGVDANMMSGAIAKALESYSQGAGDRMKTAISLRGQQSQLGNALAQGQTQNRLLAGQQSQFMPQYLAQTGMGILDRALHRGNRKESELKW